jgi:hypothetical protein
MVNRAMVNRSAPDLFPVMIWLASGLLGAKQTSAAPSAGEPQTAYNFLKIRDVLSLTNFPLN